LQKINLPINAIALPVAFSDDDFYTVLIANLINCEPYYRSSKDEFKASMREGEIKLAEE